MRNCLLTVDYPPHRGGVARYLQALIKTFPTRFLVLSSVEGNEDVETQVLSRDTGWPKWLPALKLVEGRRNDFEQLWISHLHPLGLVAWITKKRWGIPYVVILHGLDFRLGLRNPWKRFLSKRILHGAELVVCNSKALAEDVKLFAPIVDPLVVYPTLPEHLHFISGSREDSELRLLTVARLVSRKNHQVVLKALVDLPNATYTIVGDGPDRETIEEQVRELGLEERVFLRTDVSDEELTGVYGEADVFILPVLPDRVDVEGFGIVYLEAAAAGLPIIATKMRGVEEALCAEGAIQLVRPTSEAITEVVNQLKDPSRRREMGRVNRAFVKAFSREKQFAKLEPYV